MTSHLMRWGDLYTVHSGGSLSRNLLHGHWPPRFFLDKPPHAVGRPVYCILYTVYCILYTVYLSGTTTVLVALHGHGAAALAVPWFFPRQATSCGGATCTLYTRKKACQGTTTVLVALHGHWRCEANRTLVVPGQATSCGGATCTLYTVHSARAREEACQGTTTVLVALHGHWRCEATRILVVPGQATSCGGETCTLYTGFGWKGSLSRNHHGSGRLARPLAVRGDQNSGGSWTSHLMRRGDLYTVHSATAVLVAVRGDQTLVVPGQATRDLYTVHSARARGRTTDHRTTVLVWSPCTTGRARRPEPC